MTKQAGESVLERKRNASCDVLGCEFVAGNGCTRRGSGVDAWWKLESWKFVETEREESRGVGELGLGNNCGVRK